MSIRLTPSGWFKSSFSSQSSNCVELRSFGTTVLVRDSKYTGSAVQQPIVSVDSDHWPAFLELARDRVSGAVAESVAIAVHEDGGAVITGQGVPLVYDRQEWDAFVRGVATGEFDFE
ncbi:DUF397 domain-containing protein [Nocardia sp. NBC_00511]|uniref:DUF397 domain-containing protein n=1 Tax=Nocardia sp. NBC_00511 TaxID=2903591 RepID=UPI0030E45F81